MSVAIKQTVVLCHKHGDMLFEVTNGGAREHPCCPRCEPQRYFELLKNAKDIKLLSQDEIRDRRHHDARPS